MKLFAVAIAAAQAQGPLDFGLSNFDLSSFGLGDLLQPAAFEVPVVDTPQEDERYFFTVPPPVVTVPTVPITTQPSPGQKCWKCDAMTYATCASTGSYEECPLGDLDCCFVEVRETKQKLQQLCTGCKDRTACEDNRAENFNGMTNGMQFQCRSDYRYQRFGQRAAQQSVCRQCFNKCDPSTTAGQANCFGQFTTGGAGSIIAPKLVTNQASYPWTGALNGVTDSDFEFYGIPTGGILDGNTHASVITAIQGKTTLLNVYFQGADGKLNAGTADGVQDLNEMTFWGLQGASQAWWSSNLKSIQTALTGNPTPSTANFQ